MDVFDTLRDAAILEMLRFKKPLKCVKIRHIGLGPEWPETGYLTAGER